MAQTHGHACIVPLAGFGSTLEPCRLQLLPPEAVLTCKHDVMGMPSASDSALVAAGVGFKCYGPGTLH